MGTYAIDLRIIAGDDGARLLIYAGDRQGIPIMMLGPFVGESRADIMRLSRQYLDGKMPRISEIDEVEATSGNRN
jgi:redox-sensitive bicupin YhaK (pirin superfamily)